MRARRKPAGFVAAPICARLSIFLRIDRDQFEQKKLAERFRTPAVGADFAVQPSTFITNVAIFPSCIKLAQPQGEICRSRAERKAHVRSYPGGKPVRRDASACRR